MQSDNRLPKAVGHSESKRGNLCYNCLAHHKVSQCTSRFRCKKCKKKHHTSLHSGEIHKANEGESNDQKGQDPPASVIHTTLTQASHGSPLHENTVCLLKTAVAPIHVGDVKKQANILFDKGMQRSFISAEMAAKLNIIPTTTEGLTLASFGTDNATCRCHSESRDKFRGTHNITHSYISFNRTIYRSPYSELHLCFC